MSTLHDLLRRPYVTEKSNFQNTLFHQYVFEVTPTATKTQVKDAIESLYDVTVLRVNVINVPAKQSRRWRSRRMIVRRRGYKKAIVTLAPGDTIEVFEGVK